MRALATPSRAPFALPAIARLATVLAAGLAISLLAALPAHADGTIYKCVDENGRIEFTDVNKRGCKPLDLPGAIAAPAPRRNAGASSSSSRPPAAPAVTPVDFPKVNTSQQRARDNDRREILEDELRNEEKKLAELRREFNNGALDGQGADKSSAKYQERVAHLRENVNRSEQNVAALKREIGNIK
ncbi:MAG: DUF4124 domain-containing protein [Massilia sp.]